MEPNQNPSTPKNNRKKKKSKKNKNKISSQRSQPCFQFQNSGQCRFGDSCKFAHEPPPANQQIHHDPMDLFFAEYPNFDYQRSKPFYSEFYRMCRQFGWEKNDQSRREAFEEFRIALVEQFNTIYGTDENSLESWQLLCRTLGIRVPGTLKEAQKLVRETHVNLVDLTQSPRTDQPVKLFNTLQDLRDHTLDTGKFFPKEEAYEGGLLKMLLREILTTRRQGRGRGVE